MRDVAVAADEEMTMMTDRGRKKWLTNFSMMQAMNG
jgi:hypothetical protein